MTPSAGRPTESPKDIRLEIRLSERHQTMLDYCSEAYHASKAEVIRMGIECMSKADREKELQESHEDRQEMVKLAEEERENMVREEVYNEAYQQVYNEKYAEFILRLYP